MAYLEERLKYEKELLIINLDRGKDYSDLDEEMLVNAVIFRKYQAGEISHSFSKAVGCIVDRNHILTTIRNLEAKLNVNPEDKQIYCME